MAVLKQNDVRLTMNEATEISAILAAVLAGNINSPSPVKSELPTMDIHISVIDGGGFKNERMPR